MRKIEVYVQCIVLGFLLTSLPAPAQSSAFTYQGQLDDNGVFLNGSYDLRFAIFDAGVSGAQIGSTITNAPVVISNGLFTTTLDFGPGIFTGGPRWLEIGIRTNGGGSGYVIFSQRQPLTPAPYAIFAANAASANVATTATSVSAGSITSASLAANAIQASNVASGQVVKSWNGLHDNVSLQAGTNVNLEVQGNVVTISAAPSSAVGLTWQYVSGTNQSAQPNNGYVVTNDIETVINLPTNPPLFSTIRIVGAGLGGWRITQNPGQSISSTNLVLTTTPAGLVWQPSGFATNWSALAASSNGSVLFAAVDGGLVYRSTNFGSNWLALTTNNMNWKAIACTPSGTFVIGAANGSPLQISTNSGTTWMSSESSRNWISVDCSTNGITLIAATANNNGRLYHSLDAGNSWTPRDSSRNYSSVSCSADGARMLAAETNGLLYFSTNSGVSWTPCETNRGWTGVEITAGTSYATASAPNGGTLSSSDLVNWSPLSIVPGGHRGRFIRGDAFGLNLLAGYDPSGLGSGPDDAHIASSINFGSGWTVFTDIQANWTAGVVTGDGKLMVAAIRGGNIYVSRESTQLTTTTQGSNGYLSGSSGAAVELLYIGNNRFAALSSISSISAH